MTIRQIEIFLSLVETKNFTETAKKLYMTQPAVSQQVKALEADLNCTLFVRNRSGLRLTPAGVSFFNEAPSLLSHTNVVYQRVKESSLPYTTTRSLCYLPPLRILPELIEQFSAIHPEVLLRISRVEPGETNPQFIFEQHDLSVAFGEISRTYGNLKFESLYSGGFVCFLHRSHRLASHKQIHMDDLKGEIVYAIIDHPRNEMLTHLNTVFSNSREILFLPTLNGIYEGSCMVASGKAIAVFPDIGVPVSDHCVSIPLDVEDRFHLGFYRHQDAPKDIIDFCNLAKQRCDADPLPPVIF